jgi:hypothetical protein
MASGYRNRSGKGKRLTPLVIQTPPSRITRDGMWYCRIAKAHLLYGLALFVAVYALHASLRAFVSGESPPALTNRLTANLVYVSPGANYTFPDLEALSPYPFGRV